MKRLSPLSVLIRAKLILNKVLSLTIIFSILFNLTTPVFAANDIIKQEEEYLFKELNQSLQAEYEAKDNFSPLQNNLDKCLKDNEKDACDKYINEIYKMFSSTAEETSKSPRIKEEDFKPIPRNSYIKEFKKNLSEEVKINSEEIIQEYQKQKNIIEQKYKSVGINSPQYAKYILEKTEAENWKKENLEFLTNWKKQILVDIGIYYENYLSEFEKSVNDYNRAKEEYLTAFLRETVWKVMAAYEKATPYAKLKLVPVFGYLLSMESENAKLFTSAQKREIYDFFNQVIYPSNKINPCRVHTRQRNSAELEGYNAFQNQLNRIEEETRGTVSARDQIASQTRSFEERISNELKAPIKELADEPACQAAFSALTGLSYYKNWDMSRVSMFMMQNATEPMAAQALLVGTKTLIETNRLDLLNTLVLHMIDREAAYEDNDELRLKEAIFYKGKFYKTPYIYSRYLEQDGGGDAWQDMAKMLSNEKTSISKQIQHKILDQAVSFSLRDGKISFNHNLPFVYGMLLYNPSIIDSFIPSGAVAYSHSKYDYNGRLVYFQYEDDNVDLYVKDKKKGTFYLLDNVFIRDLANNASVSVAQVKKDFLEKFKKSEQGKQEAYFKYLKTNHPDLKPSAVYAEAFYRADFIDLTLQEKLAMDKALEEKYPNLKNLSATHKYKMEKNRIRAGRTSGALIIIDIAFTLWFAGDIYKGIKWSVRGIKAVRDLFVAGKAVKTLSDAKRLAFLKTFAKNNPRAIKLNRRFNKIKSMPQRTIKNFPKYKANLKISINNFNELMLKTSDYISVPSGMQGQRLAVQNYNNLLNHGKNAALSKKFEYVKAAKVSGPISILKKDGQTPLEYKEIKFNEEGFFEVDKDFLKTFKATMSPEDIAKYNRLLEGTIVDLEKTLTLNKNRFSYLTNNIQKLSAEELFEYENINNKIKLLDQLKNKRYITLRANKKTNFIEKWRSHKKDYELVPLYDAKNNVIAKVSLDMALKNSISVSKVLKNGNKLILKEGNIWLGAKKLDVNIGAPKEVISLMARAGRKVEDFSFLTLTKKSSKMWPLFYNNMLSLSAGSTSLNMSLNQAPFNNPDDPHYIPQPLIFGISVGFPYAFSLLSPMVAPFVKRFGATNTQTAALVIGGAGLAYATFNGYYGFASKKRDSMGRPIYDENGKTMPAENAPSYLPLVVSALSAGICSSLTRASLNTAIHAFQTSKASMTFSMLAKNVGSLSMVLIPWGVEAIWGKDNVDFSISYPVLTGLSILGIIFMKGFIPSSVAREVGYKIMPRRTTFIPKLRDFADMSKEVFKPFVLFKSSKIMPYYLSYLAFGGTEAFALFKTYNTFTRDSVDNFMKNTGSSKNANKLLASLIVALPSALVRGFVKRKTGVSQGVLNSIVLTTAGTLGLMLPSENRSDKWNIAVGTLSGILIACGTANMYQYLQRRMIAGISDASVAGVLPLARKFDGISGLRTTAISFYSGAYIGSFIPFGYSFLAEREVQRGETDFYANQSVLPLALRIYELGVIPLVFTNSSRIMFGKAAPYSLLFSLPLGTLGAIDLYKIFSKKNNVLMPQAYLPFNFDRNLYINPTFSKDLNLKMPVFNKEILPPLQQETK